MTDKTAIQRIKELDEERATLFEQAKGRFLEDRPRSRPAVTN